MQGIDWKEGENSRAEVESIQVTNEITSYLQLKINKFRKGGGYYLALNCYPLRLKAQINLKLQDGSSV